ncbi:hypothetical protein N7522_006257 [Penicillium canescens]|nr:hypothetical protein N7522_006257 [Penicillium canescens]
MVGEEMTEEDRKSQNPVDSAWSKNVPFVYNMLKWFNVETAHQAALEKEDDDFLYSGSLRLFEDKEFVCLRDAEAVVQLIWDDHRTVESVIAQIQLIQYDA